MIVCVRKRVIKIFSRPGGGHGKPLSYSLVGPSYVCRGFQCVATLHRFECVAPLFTHMIEAPNMRERRFVLSYAFTCCSHYSSIIPGPAATSFA